VTKIGFADSKACALRTNGELYCWGGNFYGGLGDGTTQNRSTPGLVRGLNNVIDFDVGRVGCAIENDRSLHCWGENAHGEVGDGTGINRLLPVPILVGEEVLMVRAGIQMTCALLVDRSVRCWGRGIIGDGTPEVSNFGILSPRTVANLSDVIDLNLSQGTYHTCALLSDRTARCWGRNRYGEIGDGTQTVRLVPVPVSGLDSIRQIDVGSQHTCALLMNGEVRCWGRNEFWPRLGFQTDDAFVLTTDRGPTLGGFREISMGDMHVCGLHNNGGTYCWGRNILGSVGDGTFENRVEPVLIP
jgi:alpha-tubulin suppressor-like RCC1 family protein